MYRYEELKQIHLEISSQCNAKCPQCPRNVLGGRVNPNLPMLEMTLADAQAIFPEDFVKQLDLVFMCGNYGDPMLARDTIDVLEYFRACNGQIRLAVHTNASGRCSAWWKHLAQVVTYCRFSIDGLEDTNHVYRRGTQWSKILKSIEAFIGAGGAAEWEFIVFRHNEHQVNEAMELSRKLGFRKFILKKTSRFYSPTDALNNWRSPVLDDQGKTEYYIEVPENPLYQHDSYVGLLKIVRSNQDYDVYLNQTEIDCKAINKRRIYVSAEGLTFPCSFLAKIYRWDQPVGSGEVWDLINKLPEGKSSINAKLHPIKHIVEGPFFQVLIPQSWSRQDRAEGRLAVCSRSCGRYPLYSGQMAIPTCWEQ